MKTSVVSVKFLDGTKYSCVIKSVVLAYSITFILLAIFSALLTYTNLPEGLMGVLAVISAIFSLWAGTLIVAKKNRTHGWLNGMVSGFFYILGLYILSAIVYNNYGVTISTFVMLIVCLISGAIGGIAGVNTKERKKRK
ncbi:MAG: TIGR04086 family membrane protein [Clostridiales bacterium]|jgi:putative membrane protein (TIGR04086 family)|nr:TIGR04086 family membrane protein [Clostridiales bacterium]